MDTDLQFTSIECLLLLYLENSIIQQDLGSINEDTEEITIQYAVLYLLH